MTVDGRWPNWFLVANGMQLLDFFFKKTNNAEHDGGLGMAMLSLLKLILISTGLTCMRTRTSMGDEAIVVRVHDGGVEDPVHLDEPRGGPHKPPASAGQPQEPMPHAPVGHRSPVPTLPLLDTRCWWPAAERWLLGSALAGVVGLRAAGLGSAAGRRLQRCRKQE